MKYYLASQSPRRKELLKILISDFEQISPNFAEQISEDISLEAQISSLALQKAISVSEELFEKKINCEGDIVISADTVVYLNGVMLKPRGRNDAINMLERLSGNVHHVITGIAVLKLGTNIKYVDSSITEVYFKKISREEIEEYVDTGEPMDKAGAYGIQGIGSRFIEKINGDFYSVMGLPLSKLDSILKAINGGYGF